MTTLKISLGYAVRQAREIRKLTQPALAKESGVSLSTISQLERGEKAPNIDTLEPLAHALETPLSELVARAERALTLAEEPEARRRREDAQRVLDRIEAGKSTSRLGLVEETPEVVATRRERMLAEIAELNAALEARRRVAAMPLPHAHRAWAGHPDEDCPEWVVEARKEREDWIYKVEAERG